MVAASSVTDRSHAADVGLVARRERSFVRFATLVGIVGAVIMAPLFASHPHLPPNDPGGVMQTVLDFTPWLALHFALVVGILFLLAPLLAIGRSIRDEAGPGYVSAGAAMVVALVASVFGILGQGVDGIGFHSMAELWESSPDEAKGAVLLTSAAVGVVGAGIFVLIMLFYFGLTSIVYAGACWGSKIYPRWLAIPQVLGGTLGVSAAIGTYFGSFSDFIYYFWFIPSAALFLIWIFIASIFLRRHIVKENA
jgi:hypothetical protein